MYLRVDILDLIFQHHRVYWSLILAHQNQSNYQSGFREKFRKYHSFKQMFDHLKPTVIFHRVNFSRKLDELAYLQNLLQIFDD